MKAETQARKRAAALLFNALAAPLYEDPAAPRHCEDYIADPEASPALRTYLEFARAPAHGLLSPKPHPMLFADYGGVRYRVTMASRFGDLGITRNFDAEAGYELRVAVSELTNFGVAP